MQEAVYQPYDFLALHFYRAHISILKQITIGCHIPKLCLQIIEHELEWEELCNGIGQGTIQCGLMWSDVI
jgi:hypothetical protein